MDSTARRGATVKALMCATPMQHISALRAPLIMALDLIMAGEGALPVLQELLGALNDPKLIEGLPRPSAVERELMWRSAGGEGQLRPSGSLGLTRRPEDYVWEAPHSKALFRGREVRLRFPVYNGPDEVCAVDHPVLSSLVVTLEPACLVRVYNAALAGRRVLVVGNGHAAQEVGEMVLAVSLLLHPPLEGVHGRVFPYANLTDLGFLKVAGFIAGVTNPVFESNPDWWDLLIDLDLPAKRALVRDSPALSVDRSQPGGQGEERRPQSSEEQRRFDARFAAELKSGVALGLGEGWLRSRFRSLTGAVMDLVLDSNQRGGHPRKPGREGAWERHVAAQAFRAESFRSGVNAGGFHARMGVWMESEKGRGLRRSLRRLAQGACEADDAAATKLFLDLGDWLGASEANLVALVALLPESESGGLESGGLAPVLGSALLGKSEAMRAAAAALLLKLEACKKTSPAVKAMGPLLLGELRAIQASWVIGTPTST
mmetsp:Transcript_2138/g.4593  ORF Transcript_2138/g.4593 Transcript_2138/m.4593 type:complete len:488 (-) Transcript_2138:248-1711(-)